MQPQFTRILILMIALSLSLPLTSLAQDKSVIIRFHQKPGPSESALIRGAKGKIKRTCRLIPAMAVQTPHMENQENLQIYSSTCNKETK